MWKLFLIAIFLSKAETPFQSCQRVENSFTDCRKQIDTLTKREIYVEADVLPSPGIGEAALRSRLEREILTPENVSPDNFNLNIKVAFIVNLDGRISGERIISPKSEKTGKQLLKIAKSLKWVPGKCKGENVEMLYTIPLNIDISEE